MGAVVEVVVQMRAAEPLGILPHCPTCQRPTLLVEKARPRNLQGLVGDNGFTIASN